MARLPKLVRDNIPHIIEESGKACTWRRLPDDRIIRSHFLIDKLDEEAIEFDEAAEAHNLAKTDRTPVLQEAGDMLQVCLDLWSLWGLSLEEVIEAARHKREARGGFASGIFLMSVSEGDDSLQ